MPTTAQIPQILLAGVGETIQKLVGFAVLALLARAYSQADMGQFFLAMSITWFVAAFTNLGMSLLLVRRVAAQPRQAAVLLAQVLYPRLLLTALAMLLLLTVVGTLAPQQVWLYLWLGIYMLGNEFYFVFGAVLSGLQAVTVRVLTSLIGPVTLLLLVPVALLLDASLINVLVIYAVSAVFMVAITAWVVVQRVGHFPKRIDWHGVSQTITQALPLFAITLAIMLHGRMDEMMLAALRGFEEVAVYASGYKLFEVSRMAVRPMTLILFPVLAAAAATAAWPSVRVNAQRLLWWSLLLGSLSALGMWLLAPVLVPLLFGERYTSTVSVVQTLFFSTPLLFVVHCAVMLNQAIHLIRATLIVLMMAIAVNVVGNLLVIPTYGAVGAAWTTLVSHSLAALCLLVVTVSQLRRHEARAVPRP